MTMADIAKEYGQALFELASEEKQEEYILEEIKALREILKSNPELLKVLNAPNISKDERITIVDSVFKGRMHEYLCSFLKILTERRYLSELFECFKEYESCYEDKNSVVKATVSSAVELSELQKEALKKKLCEKTGKSVDMKYHVDPELLGGIRVNMDGVLFEGTVRARLDELRNNLKKETL